MFKFRQFLATFSKDYASLEDYSEDSDRKVITVWISDGRDQATILKDMIADTFTSETGIAVNVNLVQGGLIEATLAGTAPDVAIGVARGQPVNLASRGALMDLRRFTEAANIYLTNLTSDGLSMPLIMKLEAFMGAAGAIVHPTMKAIYETMSELDTADIKVDGVNKLLNYPEYSDVSELKDRIDRQIVVKKDRSGGSHASIQA